MPAHLMADYADITQFVTPNQNTLLVETYFLDNITMRASDESPALGAHLVDFHLYRLIVRQLHHGHQPKKLARLLHQVRRHGSRTLFAGQLAALTTKSADGIGYARTELVYESDRIKLEHLTNVCGTCRLDSPPNIFPGLSLCEWRKGNTLSDLSAYRFQGRFIEQFIQAWSS